MSVHNFKTFSCNLNFSKGKSNNMLFVKLKQEYFNLKVFAHNIFVHNLFINIATETSFQIKIRNTTDIYV